ncbi:hypothetical protein [Microbispora sp. H10885]|uniref:hypothetical protein n=1 Tax=Microbispora sp. H10885 TaxID=2729110 RepID=UPI001601ADB0
MSTSSASTPATTVADFTYVHAWSGIVYVAFVVDVYCRGHRRLVGLDVQTGHAGTGRLDMALWRRGRAGHPTGPGLIHYYRRSSQIGLYKIAPNGSSGSTPPACTPPSAPSHRTNTKPSITLDTTPANPLEINP